MKRLGMSRLMVGGALKHLEQAAAQYAKAIEMKPDKKYFREPQTRIVTAITSYRREVMARIELPQGTLDVLILKTLALEPQHGWAVCERIKQISNDVVLVQQGSLYPALHRLERKGWIKARWGTSENNRRAKYYELTRSGRTRLEQDTATWRKLSMAVGQILDMG